MRLFWCLGAPLKEAKEVPTERLKVERNPGLLTGYGHLACLSDLGVDSETLRSLITLQ